MELPACVRNCFPRERRAPLVKPHGPSNEGSSLTSNRRTPSKVMRILVRLTQRKVTSGNIHVLVRVCFGSSMSWNCWTTLRSQTRTGGYHTNFLGVKQTPDLKQTLNS